jgi:hypothetical protein
MRFAVEVFATSSGRMGHRAQAARSSGAALEVAAEGSPIRYVTSVFVPADELCLHIFDAPSVETVRAVAQRAALDPLRIVEAWTDEGATLEG